MLGGYSAAIALGIHRNAGSRLTLLMSPVLAVTVGVILSQLVSLDPTLPRSVTIGKPRAAPAVAGACSLASTSA